MRQLLVQCFNHAPEQRPDFQAICARLGTIRVDGGGDGAVVNDGNNRQNNNDEDDDDRSRLDVESNRN